MSTNSSTNAACSPSTTNTNNSPYSATATNSHSFTETICWPSKSLCSSQSISHHAPTFCGVTATACCPTASLPSYTSSSGSPAPINCAASSPDYAGPASQNSQSNSNRCDCSTDHKQPKCGHPAAGQHLPYSVSCERGNDQSDSMSTYSDHSSAQSVCTCITKSSSQCCACCCTPCLFGVYEHALYICTLRVLTTDCWREATGAHSSSTCSASTQYMPARHSAIHVYISCCDPADNHCEWPSICFAACKDDR